MARLLARLSLFIGLFCAMNIVVVCAAGELLPKSLTKHFLRYRRCGGGHLFSRLEEARHVENVDILFVGTSHCYRGFDTRIFEQYGHKSFNLGSSIQTALQTELLLERYLDSIRPKHVVFEVNPNIFGNDGSESAADVISNDRIDLETVGMAFEVNKYKTYNTLIFGCYRQFTGTGSEIRELRQAGQDQYIPGGFVACRRLENKSTRTFQPVSYGFNENQMEAFEKVLEMLRRRKIPYVLVQAPVTKPLYASKINNGYVDSLLATKGKYYNFNRLLVMDDRYDFFDSDHLSQKGVGKFNHQLMAVLRRDGFFK